MEQHLHLPSPLAAAVIQGEQQHFTAGQMASQTTGHGMLPRDLKEKIVRSQTGKEKLECGTTGHV
jgi:hypothetical protein